MSLKIQPFFFDSPLAGMAAPVAVRWSRFVEFEGPGTSET